jgi:hypothetical protein
MMTSKEIISQRETKPIIHRATTCTVEIPDPCSPVIFGASGDLAKRKIVPALYRLYKNRLPPENFFVLGMSRTEMSVDQFRTWRAIPFNIGGLVLYGSTF